MSDNLNTERKILTLDEIEEQRAILEVQQNLFLDTALKSNDPSAILKAQQFLSKKNESNTAKAFVVSPEIEFFNNNGYRAPIKSVSFESLRRMARTSIPKIIITTRIDQVAGFADFTDNDQQRGWTIRKKQLFSKTSSKKENDSNIETIAKFVMNGGKENTKWDQDGFEEILRAVTRDSLELDQACIECVYSVKNELLQYFPVDAATIRLIDDSDNSEVEEKSGYQSKYAQVWQERVYTTFFPWELSFGVRNKSTDIFTNGYGISELEDMIQVITYLLYGIQYNGNFFSQGSNPKGFFSIEGNLGSNAINEFKQMWRNTISGVQNSHKVPVIEGGGKINWIDMHHSNRDMEFGSWMDFLTTIACCSFKIDPTECGFSLGKNGSTPFGQDGQKARLKHSQTKGLVPTLKMLQKLWTKYVVEPLHPDYEFIFTGIEQEDQTAALDNDVKKVQNGFMSMEDGFEKWSGRKFDPNKDTILNSVFLQKIAQEQMGGSAIGNPMGIDEEDENIEEDPFQKSQRLYMEHLIDRLKE